MKKLAICAIVSVALSSGITPTWSLSSVNAGAFTGTCQVDGEIPAAKRDAIDGGTISFVKAVLAQDSATVYEMVSHDAKISLTADKFASSIEPMVQQLGPFSDPQIAHTYFLQSIGVGSDARAICGPVTDNSWVSLEIKPGEDQAHVIVAAKTRNNDWAFTLWLVPEGSAWRIQSFHMAVSSIVGMTSDTLLERARKERDSGHLFNAAMLYSGVQTTMDRGPAFELGIGQALRNDLAKFKIPDELAGNPPFLWKMDGATCRVGAAQIGGIGKQLGLMFALPQTSWTSDQDADRKNRDFINAFIKTHPDYIRDFGFLVARAFKPDNSGGFGTVYENGKGFD